MRSARSSGFTPMPSWTLPEGLALLPVRSYNSHINQPKDMTSSTQNLLQIAADLNAAGKTVKIEVLPPRKAKKSELIFSMTKGPRTNTNRRGQAYQGHATHAQQSTVEGNRSAYFKTSG